MLFYIWYCSVFFLAILAAKTEVKEKQGTEAEKSDAIFADVIKNISRVNNVLQELINNYEQLQKIYKSQENFDAPEYSSEADVDRYFQNNKKSKRDKERSFHQYAPSAKTTGIYLHATQMFFSENEGDVSNDAKSETVNENKLKIERTPKVERLQHSPVKKQALERTSTKRKISTEESSSEDETTTAKTTTTTKATTTSVAKQKTTTNTAAAVQAAADAAEIIFVDTHKKAQQQVNEKKKPRIMPEIALEHGHKKIKTRYSVKDMPGSKKKDISYNVKKQPRFLRESANTSKATTSTTSESYQYMQMEFVPTSATWAHEDISKKPKQFMPLSRGADIKRVVSKSPVNLRSHTVTNTTIKPSKSIAVKDTQKSENTDTVSEITDDDEALNKDLFKTSVLRQAYGDACLKLVVRKCYKACKIVLKASCRSVKCKSEMKSCFKKGYKSSCDKAFEDAPDVAYRRLIKTGPHVDLTRSGYLSVACQPQADTGMQITLNQDTSVKPGETQDKELNILRDRYEKACQRTSQEKCNQACTYAHNATCIKFECEKKLKKNFRRNCKTQCKNAYMIKKGGSDSDSTSNSDSDSDSDSSSD